MKDYSVVLFDLDGTLTDPKEGITQSVRYALEDQGVYGVTLDELEPFIGPPLKWAFAEFYGFDEVQVERAIRKFRERFSGQGIFENQIYDGIAELLKALKADGKIVALATSKPTLFARQILEHFDIIQYFDYVEGSHMDESRTDKSEIMKAVLANLDRISKDTIVMVGDRKYDIEGAKNCGVDSIGVLFGYGGMEELKASGATHIVETVEALRDLLL